MLKLPNELGRSRPAHSDSALNGQEVGEQWPLLSSRGWSWSNFLPPGKLTASVALSTLSGLSNALKSNITCGLPPTTARPKWVPQTSGLAPGYSSELAGNSRAANVGRNVQE